MLRPGIAVVTVLASSSVPAEVVFDERFEQDPCAPSSGWVCREDAVWVAPGAPPCPTDDPALFTPWSSFDPLGPCTLYPGRGYVLVTPSLPQMGGAIYRAEPVSLDGVRLTAEFELRDGPAGEQGDGLAIVIIGSPEPPELGWRGGGLGATGLGEHPTFICAFRNGPRPGDPDDILYSWSEIGFPAAGWIPTQPDPFEGGIHDLTPGMLNSGMPHPAPPNRLVVELEIAGGRAAGYLSRADSSEERQPIFSREIGVFAPLFHGVVGITAATGLSYQNHVLHRMRLETLPGLRFVRGDTDASGEIDISDGIHVWGWLFLFQAEPPCHDAADSDDNGQLNITDGVRILNWLFLGGPAPPAPGPLACGTDPTADDLPQCVYRPCE